MLMRYDMDDMDDKITPQISTDYSQSEHFGIQLRRAATSRAQCGQQKSMCSLAGINILHCGSTA